MSVYADDQIKAILDGLRLDMRLKTGGIPHALTPDLKHNRGVLAQQVLFVTSTTFGIPAQVGDTPTIRAEINPNFGRDFGNTEKRRNNRQATDQYDSVTDHLKWLSREFETFDTLGPKRVFSGPKQKGMVPQIHASQQLPKTAGDRIRTGDVQLGKIVPALHDRLGKPLL